MRTIWLRCGWWVIAATLAVLAAVSPASGQGFYYKEITRDGRIYVFNNALEAARFEASGEMRRALSRPGAGPNGETVVGDSERALQLFFFKHGISETVEEPVPPLQRLEWRDGKTRITTDLAYLEISNRVQVRYTHELPDDTVTLPGTAGAGDARGSFRLRRVKLKLEGWLWKPPGVAPAPVTLPSISYELQLNWPAVTGANIGAVLEDASIAVDPKGKGQFRVLFGQFKVPFGLQQLTSSGNQSLVDRALVSDEYARGRDTGVAVQGVIFSNKLEYRAGFFNGNGLTRLTNDNANLQSNVRLVWQPNGSQVMGQRAWVSGALYSESDFESTIVPIYAFGLNFEHNDFHRTTTGNDLKSNVVGLDGIFKFKGVFATGVYYLRQRTPETGAKFRSDGGFAQVGVMLDRFRIWEAAFRYGQRDVNERVANDAVKELRAGLNYYYRRHTLKFQVDGGRVETGLGAALGSRKDSELRLQAQFIF